MPYGFNEHITQKGYRPETIESYTKVVNHFFYFIQTRYPDNKEPFNINPSDIHAYLQEQVEREKSISTINKELAIIKTLFNFLWERNIVAIDPTVKIKRMKIIEKPKVNLTYSELRDILEKVLDNEEYPSIRKSIFILALKGLKLSDFRFKVNDVSYLNTIDRISIKLRNREIVLEGKEVACFLEYYHNSIFNGSEYVFTTKLKSKSLYVPLQIMTVMTHLKIISNDYLPTKNENITLSEIRRTLAFDFYTEKNYSIQRIAKELGIEENTASNYLKNLEVG